MIAVTLEEHLARGLAACIEVGDCLEWQGRFGTGLSSCTPIVKVRQNGQTDNVIVCREVWKAGKGPIPAGKIIYRGCCNDRCVLLDHLKCGTRGDRSALWKRMGLHNHHQTTIANLTKAARRRVTTINTEAKAQAVRDLAFQGVPDDEVSALTGVSASMVADIRRGRAWKSHQGAASVFTWRP